MSDTIGNDDRGFMSLLIRVEERETIEECLDVVLEKIKSLEGEKQEADI